MGALRLAATAALLALPVAQAGDAASGHGIDALSEGTALVPATAWAAAPTTASIASGMAGDPVARWHAEIADASARFAVPIRWIEHVMRAESGGQTLWEDLPITSRAGAMGLMQVMPATWAAMRAMLRLGDDPYNPHDNILAGTAYLRILYDRFGYPGLFAAYNAGPGRYQFHLVSGQPLPAETRAYLAKVTATLPSAAIETLPSAERSVLSASVHRDTQVLPALFVSLRSGGERPDDTAAEASPGAPPDRLFAVRRVP